MHSKLLRFILDSRDCVRQFFYATSCMFPQRRNWVATMCFANFSIWNYVSLLLKEISHCVPTAERLTHAYLLSNVKRKAHV